MCCVYFDQTKPLLNFGQNVLFSHPKDGHFVTQLWLLTFATVASQNAHLWGGWNLGLGPCLKSHEFYWLQQWPSWNYKVNKAQIPPPSCQYCKQNDFYYSREVKVLGARVSASRRLYFYIVKV